MLYKFFTSAFLLIIWNHTFSQQYHQPVFKIIPLGVFGGNDESNLSSYMIGVEGSEKYVCLDAGTLHDGIKKAIDAKLFSANAVTVLKDDIQGYLISHPHLDHAAGLILNSPNDSTKNIYALPFCIQGLEESYFNWKAWANFGDDGEKPLLKKYHFVHLAEDSETALNNTNMFVTGFELSHSNPNKSSAFLIRHDSSYFLYLGDTGADSIEHSNKLALLWQHVAPIIQASQLKAIFIETSFPDKQPATQLYGHLTPALLMNEMQQLAALSGLQHLQEVKIFITHIKPEGNNEALIKKELKQLNTMHLKLAFPQQAHLIRL